MSKEIYMTRSRFGSGKPFQADKIYKVPEDMSLKDAKIFIQMKSAEWVDDEPEEEEAEETTVRKGKK